MLLEKKLLKKVAEGLLVIGTIWTMASCEGKECMAPTYKTKPTANYSTAPGEQIIGETQDKKFSLSATCPDGCTYDSNVGCCWCPD